VCGRRNSKLSALGFDKEFVLERFVRSVFGACKTPWDHSAEGLFKRKKKKKRKKKGSRSLFPP